MIRPVLFGAILLLGTTLAGARIAADIAGDPDRVYRHLKGLEGGGGYTTTTTISPATRTFKRPPQPIMARPQ